MTTLPTTTSARFDTPPPAIDVSGLPESAFDWRDPVWWGNTLLILIETTTVALLLAAYFYIRRNYEVWPPPKVDVFPPIYDTAPRLITGTINTIVIVLSCALVWWTDVQARAKHRTAVIIGTTILFLLSALACWLRFYEFRAVWFWWNDNAYASVVWALLGLHWTYLIGACLEFLLMLAWVVMRDLDDHHALDMTLIGGYWYWIAATWVLIYATVYFGPRVL
jgi:heme/copper-type cytochrome/quinol oxidase subunit 3